MKTFLRPLKKFLRGFLPLAIRKQLAIFINRQLWLNNDHRTRWSVELLDDFAKQDSNTYHKFLWSHHMAYADTYEVAQRFGFDNIKDSRKLLFQDMTKVLHELDIVPQEDIKSILDVGCSLGYLLRYLEERIFLKAEQLDGLDIDEYAIDRGTSYLMTVNSKIQLSCADMEDLAQILHEKQYDVILCAGVLMYLNGTRAAKMVQTLLCSTNRLLVLSGIACESTDNETLGESVIRQSDGSFAHNLDTMVKQAGGSILFRRWEGSKKLGGNTLYFVFAVKNS